MVKLRMAHEDVHVFRKGKVEKLSENFVSTEFDCKCGFLTCERTVVSRQLVDRLEDLRVYMENKPIHITSGYRCKEQNSIVGGHEDSLHIWGLAVDLNSNHKDPVEMAIYAREMQFPGIGRYPYHIHLDFGTVNRRWVK